MKYTTQVIKGHGRGKLLGYPTFNLDIPLTLPLKPGVYAVWVWINDKKYQGALHYGPVPVFEQEEISLEVFVLDYKDRSPVPQLTFEPVKYLRPITSFSTPQALTNQIKKDVRQVEQMIQDTYS